MVDAAVGPHYRVVCEPCDKERTVPSRVVAEDIVAAHAAEEHCGHADWELVEDD